MKIGIIGAGFTGLSAAYRLCKIGHDVTVFEKENLPGGLAVGFKEKEWDWSLEKHYHHWFTNDFNVLRLAKEINYEVLIKRPKTSVYVENSIYQLDSPLSILEFPKLEIAERLRMALVLGLLRYNPFWQPLENINATDFLPKTMGKKAYKVLWEPLFKSKFGAYANNISLAWFWARIKKRTPALAYPKGGFLDFAESLVNHITKDGGKVLFETEITKIESGIDGKSSLAIRLKESESKEEFDKVIMTLPSFLFLKLAPELPNDYKQRLQQLEGIGATNLLLRLKEPFLPDNTYWLNICEKNTPVMAIVEHTNFMDKKHYNNEHLVYLGNYLPQSDPRFKLNKEELLAIYDKLLHRINPNYKKSLIGYEKFSVPFAQPIIPLGYSKIIPPLKTPLKNVYLANIQQVYPWDRGTNYAIELGEKVTSLLINQQ